MDKFYFFKVTLIYYDDVAETFFITPDQSERDEDGIPFSEQELRNTPEFKAFVKKNKADVVDVKYVEYAVEKDENKTVILGGDITAESFKTLENHDELEIVEQNEFPLIIKQMKKAGGGSKMHYVCLAAAAVAVFAFLFANAPKMGKIPYDESSSDYSEETGSDSDTSSSSSVSSSSSSDTSSSSSVSSSSSSDTSSSESASSSDSDTSSSEDESSSSSSDTSSSSSVNNTDASE